MRSQSRLAYRPVLDWTLPLHRVRAPSYYSHDHTLLHVQEQQQGMMDENSGRADVPPSGPVSLRAAENAPVDDGAYYADNRWRSDLRVRARADGPE
jgi:hypothetical protein